ncbi:MAG: formate/nitrite transporter family protein, partial [Acidobacteria bacterium]|nr:formate/nitrite transporter family protein [Acidobacteriota bacterium]
MDYVTPAELVEEAVQLGEKKAGLPVRDLLVRSILCGVLLSYATSLAWLVMTQGLPPIAGAIVFPVGFVMLVLLGFEMATGNFCLLPLGLAAGRVRMSDLLRNWGWVYLGNLMGAVFYALLFALVITKFGSVDGGPLAEQARVVAQNKTKYIHEVRIAKTAGSPLQEIWFDQTTVPFNYDLVAIIGNKGTGKSALADILG